MYVIRFVRLIKKYTRLRNNAVINGTSSSGGSRVIFFDLKLYGLSLLFRAPPSHRYSYF